MIVERLKSKIADLRGQGGETEDRPQSVSQQLTDGGVASESATGKQSQLYSCSSCERVFVATEKSHCSNCEETVEKVPATLADASDR
jgi:hypothetical protein